MSEFFSTPIRGLDYMTFFSIVDQSYDELLIYDDNFNIVYIKEKRPFAQKQMTRVGSELLTIAVPVFDDKQKLRFVVMNVRADSAYAFIVSARISAGRTAYEYFFSRAFSSSTVFLLI